MCGTTVFCDYFICVTIPISLSHFLNPFSFEIILQKVLFILLLFLAPGLGSMFYLFGFFYINSAIGIQSLLFGSYFFCLVLRGHLPTSHEFHGQSGQRNIIKIYSFCCQLMPLACAH